MKLHELVRRTYNKILKPLFKIEVLSDIGWENISSLNIAENKHVIQIKTKNYKLICTPDHILIDINGNEIFAKDSYDKIIQCETGGEKVISVTYLDKTQTVYDLSLTGDNHLFFANDILSHNCLILDEMAFIPNNIIDDFFASVMPIISSSKNSKAIIVSTPNGASGLYYELWQQANSKSKEGNLDGWKPFRIYWWETGGIRDEAWKQKQIATIGLERWKQEFECDFLTSSTKRLIPEDVLERYKMKLSEYKTLNLINGKKHKILSENEDRVYEFTMWHSFKPDRTYAASADISEGLGGNADSSVLYVWDITDLSEIIMCAKFSSNKVSTVEFAFITNRILSLYNNPWLIAERNGISGGMLDSLKITYKYPHIVQEGKRGEHGIFSHVQTKGKACLWTREMMTNGCFGFKLYDSDLIDEFYTFVKKDTKGVHAVYTALPKTHDDHVMTFIWLCYLLHNEIIEKYYIVATTIQTGLDQIYPRRIEPQQIYTDADIQNITDDPIYKDFLEFKAELQKKLNIEIDKENNTNDSFYQHNNQVDIYFQDPVPRALSYGSKLNTENNFIPGIFINGGGWSF